MDNNFNATTQVWNDPAAPRRSDTKRATIFLLGEDVQQKVRVRDSLTVTLTNRTCTFPTVRVASAVSNGSMHPRSGAMTPLPIPLR